MSLLTDREIDAAWARSPQNNLRDYAKEIEAAVLRKLATVSVEPVVTVDAKMSEIIPAGTRLYTETALAAARVQGRRKAVYDCLDELAKNGYMPDGVLATRMHSALIGGPTT